MLFSSNKILTSYDIILVFSPDTEKTEIKDIITNFVSYLKYWDNKCLKVNYIGRKILSYPIKKYSTATFINLKVLANPSSINRLQETFCQEEKIIRSQLVKF